MNELLKINYDTETPTVSARDLHEQLHIKTAFKDWFPRMCEYGFEDGKDFSSKMSEIITRTLEAKYKAYGIYIEFGKNLPKKFVIRTYSDKVLHDTVTI